MRITHAKVFTDPCTYQQNLEVRVVFHKFSLDELDFFPTLLGSEFGEELKRACIALKEQNERKLHDAS